MKLLTEKLVQQLLSKNEEPCISLYLPTHRSHPDNQQDPIMFKNLLKEIQTSLLQKYSNDETNEFLKPLEELIDNPEIWNLTLEGLAVFSSASVMEIVKLQVAVEPLAIVADSFHTKPLRKYLQSVDRFHVLGLSLHDITLYEGNRHYLTEIDLMEVVPRTIEEALGYELTDKHTTVASYGGTSGESSSMRHGHGGKKEEMDVDAERFFREIGKSIQEHYSKPSGLPLILAALPEHHNLFQKLSENPLLVSNGIKVNPKSVPEERLIELAWEVMEPQYQKTLDILVEKFEQARADGKGGDDYKELAIAAVEGRIDTLILESNKVIAARITNLETGNTQKKDINNPRVDDLLDDMGELVLKMGGKVVVMPSEKIPTETGMAAIYRY